MTRRLSELWLQNLNQVCDFGYHAANRGGIFEHRLTIQPSKTEADDRGTVRLARTDGAANQLDSDRCFV